MTNSKEGEDRGANASLNNLKDRGIQQPLAATPSTTESPTISPPNGWTRCRVYLPRKRRFCRQNPVPNDPRCFCGNHQHIPTTSLRQEEGKEAELPTIASLSEPSTTTQQSTTYYGSSFKRKRAFSRRIPCPVDPRHWIAEHSVDRHVLICPKTKQAQEQILQPYFCQDCNAGGHGSIALEESCVVPLSLEHAKTLALAVLATHQRLFANSIRTTAPLAEEVDVRLLSLLDIENALELEDFSSSSLSSRNTENNNLNLEQQQHRIRFGSEKHTKQQESLLGHLKRVHDPTSKSSLVIEVGAGRGMMGLVAAATLAAKHHNSSSQHLVGSSSNSKHETTLPTDSGCPSTDLVPLLQTKSEQSKTKANTKLLMIEKTGSRGKADKAFRNSQEVSPTAAGQSSTLRLDLVDWRRISCDLQNVQLKALIEHCFPPLQHEQQGSSSSSMSPPQSVHIVGKHVCGVGTDLSLKALRQLLVCDSTTKNGAVGKVKSCIMATCCHGVCNWQDYVGRDFLRHALLSPSRRQSTTVTKESNIMEESSAGTLQSTGPQLTRFGPAEFECLRKWCAASVATTTTTTTTKSATTERISNDETMGSQQSKKRQGEAPSVELPEEGRYDENAHSIVSSKAADDEETDGVIRVSTVVEALGLSCGMAGLGRACQRLLDYGRLLYLRDVLKFESVKLVHYVPSSVTPQNAVLVAHNDSPSSLGPDGLTYL
ncbi:hypothetical protein ACA910_017745 [Epithemia clementina (nom. ined.)]